MDFKDFPACVLFHLALYGIELVFDFLVLILQSLGFLKQLLFEDQMADAVVLNLLFYLV